MKIRRSRTSVIEIFKKINNINLSFMKDIFPPNILKSELMISLLNIKSLQKRVTKA